MKKITIFTAKSCPNCPAAKAVVEEVAKETGAEVEHVEIGEDEDSDISPVDALMEGICGTPSVKVGGSIFCRSEVPDKQKLLDVVKG